MTYVIGAYMSFFSFAAFLVYATVIMAMSLVLIFYCSPRWGHQNPLIYVTINGTIGSLTVMGCKGLGVAIKQTVEGENQFYNWLTWFIIITVIINLATQMNYLNRALDVFNTAVVTPILYVIFTAFVILASAILYKEWYTVGAADATGIVCGFLTICSGIFLLNAFKDVHVTLASVHRKHNTTELPEYKENLLHEPEIDYRNSINRDVWPLMIRQHWLG